MFVAIALVMDLVRRLPTCSENLVLDQLIIPKSMKFSLFISLFWLILYLYCKEKLSWSFMGVKGLSLERD